MKQISRLNEYYSYQRPGLMQNRSCCCVYRETGKEFTIMIALWRVKRLIRTSTVNECSSRLYPCGINQEKPRNIYLDDAKTRVYLPSLAIIVTLNNPVLRGVYHVLSNNQYPYMVPGGRNWTIFRRHPICKRIRFTEKK